MPQLPTIAHPWLATPARALLGTAFRFFSGMTVVGQEHVPREGPVLICPNHLSDCDPAAIYVACPRSDIAFVAKEELFSMPVLGTLLRSFGGICIRRDSADRAALRQIESVLNRGAVVVLFPEGRLSESGRLGRLQPGAAMLSLRTCAAIVPTGLARTNCVLPYGDLVPRRSRLPVRLQFGPSLVPPVGGKGRARIDFVTDALESEIRRLTEQHSGGYRTVATESCALGAR